MTEIRKKYKFYGRCTGRWISVYGKIPGTVIGLDRMGGKTNMMERLRWRFREESQ